MTETLREHVIEVLKTVFDPEIPVNIYEIGLIYEVVISYGRSARSGGALRIGVGDESVEFNPPPTPTADVFERVGVGTLTLGEGPAILKAEVAKGHGGEVMRLNRIFLRRDGYSQ